MEQKQGRCTRQRKQPVNSHIAILWVLFNKAIIPLALAGYEIVIANSVLLASLDIYHLILWVDGKLSPVSLVYI